MQALSRPLRQLLVSRLDRSFHTTQAEQLQRHQQRRLDILSRAISQRSPYYRRLRAEGWDGRIQNLPCLSKQEMLAHFDEINTAGLNRDELFQFALAQQSGEQAGLFKGRYSVGLSSGTSGTRLPTVLSPWERWNYGSLLFARSGIPRTIQKPRVLFLLRVNNPAFTEVRFLGVELVFFDYTHPPEALVEVINQRKLNVLAGPPSMLRLLGRLRDAIHSPVEALISYAEVLDDGTRQQLRSDFNAPISQIYQGAEGFIASTCWMGNLHLNEDVVFVEALEAGDAMNKARRVVVTDLYRTTQPFIRYQLNDILELSDERCGCGSCFRLVERIHGRADDIFYLQDEQGRTRYLFPDYVVRSINQASEKVLEFQAIQLSPESIEIRLQLAAGSNRPEIERQIISNLQYWARRAGGSLGRVGFSDQPPEHHPVSHKLIRVTRKY